jgi:hypothetical protein
MTTRTIALLLVVLGSALTMPARAESEWLSLGSKHWAPTVYRKSGIGTANAVAEARVTREAISGWCENWSPDDRDCVQREMASDMAKATYRASADCTRGRITAVDGKTYTLAGRWDNSDIGGGRTRWRDASGHIVGRDNASGGLGISQQWEVLCPEGRARAGSGGAAAAPAVPRPQAAQPAAGAQRAPTGSAAPGASPLAARFAPGQAVEARYGSGWVRARIDSVQRVRGAAGPEYAYNVRLENGLRSQLPARMLREPLGR